MVEKLAIIGKDLSLLFLSQNNAKSDSYIKFWPI